MTGLREVTHFIDGRWVTVTGDRRPIEAPDGRVLASMPVGSAADAEQAFAAAQAAQAGWAALTLEERLTALSVFADRVEGALDAICLAEHEDMGMPLPLSRAFGAGTVALMRRQIGLAREYEYERRIEGPTGTTVIRRNPLGVAAVVIPWNFAVSSLLGSLVSLLASGNTVIVKPSEFSTLSVVELFAAAGEALPAGVLGLLLGDHRAGAPLTQHPGLGFVRFTGSVGVGRAVGAASGGNLVRSQLELGGKDVAIVDDGVDIDAVAADVARGAFTNSGQICTSIERIYVVESVAERFIEALAAHAPRFARAGEEAIGPLVHRRQFDAVRSHVDAAIAAGATAIEAGTADPAGSYFPPTILVGVDDEMAVMSEETFGPIAPVRVVDSFATALRLAESSEFGLAATVYTPDHAHREAASGMSVALTAFDRWRASDGLGVYEPAGVSGMGATGSTTTFDASTRPSTVFFPRA